MSTCNVCPAFAPRMATGPVHMWPKNRCGPFAAWIAGNAGGMRNGGAGIRSGEPDTVEMVTRSPLSMVSTGASRASKYPQCTVSAPASRRAMSVGLFKGILLGGLRWIAVSFVQRRGRPTRCTRRESKVHASQPVAIIGIRTPRRQHRAGIHVDVEAGAAVQQVPQAKLAQRVVVFVERKSVES